MNLSPQWVPALQQHGWQAMHWSDVGDPKASDQEIMDWAAARQLVVFTHDLDFGTMLALSHDNGPSVLQVRNEDALPEAVAGPVIAAPRATRGRLDLRGPRRGRQPPKSCPDIADLGLPSSPIPWHRTSRGRQPTSALHLRRRLEQRRAAHQSLFPLSSGRLDSKHLSSEGRLRRCPEGFAHGYR